MIEYCTKPQENYPKILLGAYGVPKLTSHIFLLSLKTIDLNLIIIYFKWEAVFHVYEFGAPATVSLFVLHTR